jgi:hypothetical protein
MLFFLKKSEAIDFIALVHKVKFNRCHFNYQINCCNYILLIILIEPILTLMEYLKTHFHSDKLY